MNISPINLAAVEPQTKPEEKVRKYAVKDAPIPETPKDEVSFGAVPTTIFYDTTKNYDKLLREISSTFISNGESLDRVWRALVDSMNDYVRRGLLNGKDNHYVLKYDNFKRIFPSTYISDHAFEPFGRELPKFSPSTSKEYVEMYKNFSTALRNRDSVVFVEAKDGTPVLTLRTLKPRTKIDSSELLHSKRNKIGFRPNVYEIEFASPEFGDKMKCVFGINDVGELTLKQSNINAPRYTAYGSDIVAHEYPKIVIEGKKARFYNSDGSRDWFKSLLLKLCYKS